MIIRYSITGPKPRFLMIVKTLVRECVPTVKAFVGCQYIPQYCVFLSMDVQADLGLCFY